MKGYMYITDVTMAILLLIIGITLLYYQFATDLAPVYFTEHLSEDIIGVLAHTNVNDLCDNPGEAGCNCLRYQELNRIVCSDPPLSSYDVTLLELFSEVLERGTHDQAAIPDIIFDLFVHSKAIDEKRFGFAVIYTDLGGSQAFELYNSDTYIP